MVMTTIKHNSLIIQLGEEILEEIRKPVVDWKKVIANNRMRRKLMTESVAEIQKWVNPDVDKRDDTVLK